MSPHRALLLAAVLVPLLLTVSPPAQGAISVIGVSTTADDVLDNGNCTLREAVIAANTDAAVDRCPAGSGQDTIVLRAGTYLLSLTGAHEDAAHTGDLDLDHAVVIRGAGAGATVIDGGSYPDDGDRVFHVLAAGAAAIFGVTIRGGLCEGGGGVLNQGTLTIADSVLTDNIVNEVVSCGPVFGGGAAIYNTGELWVLRSHVSGNAVHGTSDSDVAYPGGGLLNHGAARIRETVVADNYAAAGGGLWNAGTLEVLDSEIDDNRARFWGAGLDNVSSGQATLNRTTVSNNVDGGILNGTSASLVLRNSTVSGNNNLRVAGAIFNFGGPVQVISSTIANNQSSTAPPCDGPPCPLPVAGISGPAQLAHTILSNPGYSNCLDSLSSDGHNVDSDGSCGLNAPGDLSNVDPLLGPLADNGGLTRTHALDAASPAIDRVPADQCLVATDQRRVGRPQPPKRGGCDVGAYEFSPAEDIAMIMRDIQIMYGVLTSEQSFDLLDPLKLASLDIADGLPEHACQMLGVFITTLASFVADGILSQDQAQPLADDAARVMAMICP